MATNKCVHKDLFFCTTVSTEEGPMYAFACIQRCGFWLNFDPAYAGNIKEEIVPKDYRHDCWRLNTVSFLPFPDPNRKWKDTVPLSTGGKY